MANELDESLLHSVAERHVGKCQETGRPEAYKLGEPSSVMIPFSTHGSFQSAIYPQGKYYLPTPVFVPVLFYRITYCVFPLGQPPLHPHHG